MNSINSILLLEFKTDAIDKNKRKSNTCYSSVRKSRNIIKY
jgi:hypothetical protein